MKKNNIIIILQNDEVIINGLDNHIIKYCLKNSIYEGRIINKNKFAQNIDTILKKEKLYKLFRTKIYCIYEPFLKYEDKNSIIECFENINIKDVKMINKLSLLDKNKIFIEYNNNYVIMYYAKKYYKFIINNIIDLSDILNSIKNKVDCDIFLLTNNDEIIFKFDDYYYFEDIDNLFIEILRKRIV